jgi:tellurite resistance protein
MSSKSVRKKYTFVCVFLSMILLAWFTAHKVTEHTTREALLTGAQVSSSSIENSFFGFYLAGLIILVRMMMSEAKFLRPPPIVLVFYTYAASLYFTLFSMFISPENAVVNILIYFMPVLYWHQKKIKTWVFVIISLILAGISIVFFGKIGSFLLLLPMLHLVAIRANNSLKSRYANDSQRIYTQLSSTQKQQVGGTVFRKNFDWWAVIEPELDDLLESWATITKGRGSSYSGITVNDGFLSIQNYNEFNRAKQQIIGRDPKFSPEKFLAKFSKIFKQVTTACNNHSIESIQPMLSDALYEQFKCRVEEQKKAGIKFKLSGIEVMHNEIKRIATTGEFDEIHVLVSAIIKETAIDMVTQKPLSTDKDTDNQIHEFWTFIRRSTATTQEKRGLADNICPNCGNPLKIGQATLCSACNSYIRSGNFDWVLSQIAQAGEWAYSSPALLPKWRQLNEEDKHLCIQQIEDKAAVIFWMLKSAEQTRNNEALLRFATPECFDLLNKFLFASKVKFSYNESISLGGVNLKAVAIKSDKAYLYILITWSGIPVSFDAKGRVPTVHRFVKPYRDVFVLTRQLTAKTKVDNALSSAHCFNCGGPLGSSFDAKCSYCSTVLNDGTEWILEKILKENSNEYRMALNDRPMILGAKKGAPQTQNKEPEKPLTGQTIRSGHETVAIAAAVMLADGVIEDSEMSLLKGIGRGFKMSEATVLSILEAVKLGDFPSVNIMCTSYEEIREMIDVAIAMALADGNISPEEKETILTFAKTLNYVESDVNMRIRKVMKDKGLT